jgi:hypothetical protein
MNFPELLALIFFLTAGGLITHKLKNYEPRSQLEQKLHGKNKKKALKSIWTCIVTIGTVVIFQ